MVEATAREAIKRIHASAEPEDLFGHVDAAGLRSAYRRLAREVHPDRNGGDEDAARAFLRLNDLYGLAVDLQSTGRYGEPRAPRVTVRTRGGRSYVVGERVGRTETSDLFECDYGLAHAVFKVARHPRDNDLIRGEAGTLRRLHRRVEPRWTPFLPSLVDEVNFRVPGGVSRRAVVLAPYDDGFVTLERVTAAHPHGLDPRDMAWMFRRLLGILGAAHEQDVVHAAITPASVLIHPRHHGLVVADWEYAIPRGDRVRAVSRAYRDLYPPELDERKRLGVEADIYMAARTMLDVVCPRLRSGVSMGLPRPLRAFFSACLLPERKRLDDAWQAQGFLDDILERLYGPRRFRPFHMPATP